MERVHRTDFATTATRVESTPQGGVRVRARVARTGVLRYSDASGRTWGEYRPPEEVFSEDSLATLRGATVTDLHPSTLVDPQTYRELARGHAHDDVAAEDGRYVAATLAVNDGELCRMVLDGERRDVSAGYTCEVEPAAGVSPEGEPYEGIQRRIRFNHIALGPLGWGRSGTDVGLRMDGAAHEVSAGGPAAFTENSMKIKFRGREYRADAAEEMAACQKDADALDKAYEGMKGDIAKKDADNAALAAELAAVREQLMKSVGQCAALEAKMAAQQAAAPAPVSADMVPEEVMDAALAQRDALRADAAVILGAEGVKDMKSASLKSAALAKLSVKTDGLDAKLVDAMFATAVATARQAAQGGVRNDALAKVNEIGNAAPTQRSDDATPEGMHEREASRWKQPLRTTIGKGA